MKTKYKKEIEKSKEFREIIEDFLDSDSGYATAAKFLLAFIALGGVMVVGAVAPAIFAATKNIRRQRKYSEKQIRDAYYNLKKKNLIEIIEEGDEKFKVKLTNKGAEKVREFSYDALEISKPEHWDKKWRILIFDIPTKPKIYNQARNALRDKIKELGFYQMQKSVWVCPYECEEEILFVAELFQVQKHIEMITAEKVLHEEILKSKFGLT